MFRDFIKTLSLTLNFFLSPRNVLMLLFKFFIVPVAVITVFMGVIYGYAHYFPSENLGAMMMSGGVHDVGDGKHGNPLVALFALLVMIALSLYMFLFFIDFCRYAVRWSFEDNIELSFFDFTGVFRKENFMVLRKYVFASFASIFFAFIISALVLLVVGVVYYGYFSFIAVGEGVFDYKFHLPNATIAMFFLWLILSSLLGARFFMYVIPMTILKAEPPSIRKSFKLSSFKEAIMVLLLGLVFFAPFHMLLDVYWLKDSLSSVTFMEHDMYLAKSVRSVVLVVLYMLLSFAFGIAAAIFAYMRYVKHLGDGGNSRVGK